MNQLLESDCVEYLKTDDAYLTPGVLYLQHFWLSFDVSRHQTNISIE